ncbi:MAG: hypothetical protein JNL21_27685 [Myxococcales bacterium]|nr:hypothetical protein [Myxococcales bacterium]
MSGDDLKFQGVATRLAPSDLKRLDKIARRLRIKRTQVVRIALVRGLDLLEASPPAPTTEGT